MIADTFPPKVENPLAGLLKQKPYYHTWYGAAYLDDALKVMKEIPENSINLIVTSPPYALVFKKEYGNKDASEYVEWFMTFAREFKRILTTDGSFVLNIGGVWNKGTPTRALYQYELLLDLCKIFHLAQEFYWYNPAKLPAPAEWVTVRRVRVKDAVEHLWWFSKTEHPQANNRKVLQPYSQDMQRLIERGVKAKKRPSGHNITQKFSNGNGGSIPPNVLIFGNNDSNSQYFKLCRENNIAPHPARYPEDLPNFFIDFLTDERDVVLDPFCGSNATGSAAEKKKRKWIGIDLSEDYLKGSKFRFPAVFN